MLRKDWLRTSFVLIEIHWINKNLQNTRLKLIKARQVIKIG